ncbi:phosphopantetheine-binding protein, partial [Nocardia sp. NPDC088792]|uniref:phosphopantetheine-binding protein n=1 Tax=Nocardia sp. NPDC088792 TaxID=3364332 RepID=UPI0037FF169F
LDLIVLRARPDLPALWHGLTGGPQRPTARQQDHHDVLARLTPQERQQRLLIVVRDTVAAVLGYRREQVSTTKAFTDLGFDSLSAVELRNRLQAVTGTTLPATLVFDHPNAQRLATHLTSLLGNTTGDGTGATMSSLLSQLEVFTAAFVAADLIAAERDGIANRLRAMLDTSHPPASVDDGEKWETPDEVYRFIEDELGLSGDEL